jgi:hypothetical protein
MGVFGNYKAKNIKIPIYDITMYYGYWDMPEENADLDSGFSKIVVRDMGIIIIDMPYNNLKKIILFGQLPFIEAYTMSENRPIKSRHKKLISLSDIISIDPIIFILNTQPRPDTSGVI